MKKWRTISHLPSSADKPPKCRSVCSPIAKQRVPGRTTFRTNELMATKLDIVGCFRWIVRLVIVWVMEVWDGELLPEVSYPSFVEERKL